jgi:uncharacterized protein (TIGR02099 family)
MFTQRTFFHCIANWASHAWRRIRFGYRVLNRITHHALSLALTGLLVLYFLFCGTVLVLRYGVLPNIDRYKPNVEQMASKALSRPVSIATIHASWQGLNPHLVLNDVVMHNRNGQAALSLPQVSATLSWKSLMVAGLRLDYLQVDRPDVEVERSADGTLYVGGVEIEKGGAEDGKGLEWLLSQREIVVRNGWIRWRDAQRGAPELRLEKVDFLLRNQWRHHRFAFRATPPAELGAPLDVRADFSHPSFARRISDVQRWTGTVYADWRDTELARWRPYIDYPVELREGKGAMRVWLEFDQARVAGFTADLALAGLWARLGSELEPLSLKQAQGRIAASEVLGGGEDGVPTLGAFGHAVTLTDFSMETDDGLTLPPTTIGETYTAATEKTPAHTEVRATLLDLQAIASFVGRLPLDETRRHLLAHIAPRGTLRDFTASWQGQFPDIPAYHVKGRFSGLSIAPQPARDGKPALPGFDHLDGVVDVSERGGGVTLASTNATIRLPGILSEAALPFDTLELQANWVWRQQQLQLDIGHLRFSQQGMTGLVSGKYQASLVDGHIAGPGVVDLTGKLDAFDVAQIGRFLPVATPPKLSAWLSGALEAGHARDVALVLKGDLAHFPFAAGQHQKGQFHVSGKIEDGRLNYTPGDNADNAGRPLWPLLEKINGKFTFERSRMEVHADSAQTSKVKLSNVDAVIADLADHAHLLDIRGTASGALQDYLQFTRDSPVAEWIGHFTEESQASGDARLALKLQLPLAHMKEVKVQGALQFQNNDIVLEPAIPPLLQTAGELKFHEKGFSLNGIRTAFLGGPASVTGGSQRDGTIAIRAEGALTAEGLRATYPAPVMQRLLARVSGGSRYSAQINVKNKRPEIVVESSLQGLALDFPAPLKKSGGNAMPFRFDMAAAPSTSTQGAELRDELKLTLGRTIEARYSRRKPDDRHAAWQVVRGGIGVNAPAPQPDSGLVANLAVDHLDADAWRATASAIVGEKAGDSGGAGSHGAGDGDMGQYVDPDTLAARATELIIMGKKLENVVVGASHADNAWQANIDSAQASGHVAWAESRSGRGLGKVSARLSSLIIPESSPSAMADLTEEKSVTTQIPALDIIADRFELGGKKMGRLELTANNARVNGQREWQISRLSIANPDGTLNATGKWIIRDGENASSLNYKLDVADAGRLLERFGFANVLRGGRGTMQGDLNWIGLPFSMDMASLSGQMQLNMAAGQFLKVDPGAAKLLGVLSLQSLPRRLTLDFRDVFSDGFAFDGVVANASISHGVMYTDNFKMRSVAAAVLIDGSVDIVKETQNLNVVVLPEINVGAASVAYGLMVNPVIGLGTFLAQLVLRDPLTAAFTMEYQIAGSWKDPAISKVDRHNRKPNAMAGAAADKQGKQAR